MSLLADGAAASRMAQGGIGWVIVGSDRIAANGDVANKIGTYGLAVAARHHGVRVMVVAPTSTLDMRLASGREIPIEVRSAEELLGLWRRTGGRRGGGGVESGIRRDPRRTGGRDCHGKGGCMVAEPKKDGKIALEVS